MRPELIAIDPLHGGLTGGQARRADDRVVIFRSMMRAARYPILSFPPVAAAR